MLHFRFLELLTLLKHVQDNGLEMDGQLPL